MPQQSRSGRINITLLGKTIPVYAGKKVKEAFDEVSMSMDLYKGVKLEQLLDALYNQGHKDGARKAFSVLDAAKKQVKYRNPGQPRKQR